MFLSLLQPINAIFAHFFYITDKFLYFSEKPWQFGKTAAPQVGKICKKAKISALEH